MSVLAQGLPVHAAVGQLVSDRMWQQPLTEATHLELPTKFLKVLPPDFVPFEFDDLRAYAAEYHPVGHRLVLNRTLSFNAAGGVLRPLTKLTHKELEVLYHELFHAYMDFVSTEQERLSTIPGRSSLLTFARRQQRCRYSEVAIAPVVQRKGEAETRYLTESESWEALNETWAVFIGWAIWSQLEIKHNGGKALSHEGWGRQWVDRLEKAVQGLGLKGYYVPEDPEEQRGAQKRFLAGASPISGAEAVFLMTEVLGFSDRLVRKLTTSPRLVAFFKAEAACTLAGQ